MNRKQPKLVKKEILILFVIGALILLLALIRAEIILASLSEEIKGYIDLGLVIATVLAITWFVQLFLGRLYFKYMANSTKTEGEVKSTWRLMVTLIWLIVIVALLFSLMSDPSSWAIIIGLIGAAVAFVLQQPLLNIAGWVAISYRSLYRMGDRISISDTSGYVIDINTQQTRVREFGGWMEADMFTGRIVEIPNSFVFSRILFNYTRDDPTIWDKVSVLVTYESDTDAAVDLIVQAAKDVVGEYMTSNFTSYCNKMELSELRATVPKQPRVGMRFSDSGVIISVLYLCDAAKRIQVRSEVTKRIWRSYNQDDRVEIAYPHTQLLGRISTDYTTSKPGSEGPDVDMD